MATNNNFDFAFELYAKNQLPNEYKSVINKLTNITLKPSRSFTIPKVSIIRDIPNYLEVDFSKRDDNIGIRKVPQYKGYLINLKKFSDIHDFFSQTLSKNSRKNFRSKHRRLESENQISYEFYHGNLSKIQYDYLFDVCYDLMEARFHQKKIYNRYLINWKYYYDLFYPLILSKKASLFVIYDEKKPITITLNFHHTDIVFSYIQIYDLNYSKYTLGDIAAYKNIEWCYSNKIAVWDLSKGSTDKKLRWSNHVYQFDYHLFYNCKSPISKVLVFLIEKKLTLKQLLRNRGIIGNLFQLDKVYYYTKMKSLKNYNWKGR